MSGKLKQRNAANSTDSATVTINEKILKECHSLYIESEKGRMSLLTVSIFLGDCDLFDFMWILTGLLFFINL